MTKRAVYRPIPRDPEFVEWIDGEWKKLAIENANRELDAINAARDRVLANDKAPRDGHGAAQNIRNRHSGDCTR